jgi:hypothetical protein
MTRSTAIVFVVLGAALAGFAYSSATGKFDEKTVDVRPSVAAGPQRVKLDWRETYGKPGEQFVFGVDGFQVLADGWRAQLELVNDTTMPYEVGDPRAALDRAFGVMLFSTGSTQELERRNSDDELPVTRPAVRYEPRLPKILEPGASWRGTISAPGPLVARSWLRVVFGALVAVGTAQDGLDQRVIWITDHAYELKP